MPENLQLLELIDKERLDEILSGFTKITGVSSFIVSPQGRPISAQYNWTRLCSDYCRSTKRGKQLCYESDRYGAEMSARLKKRVNYTCLNAGLIDCTSPIIVGNYHIASFMCGQVLHKPIDESTAKKNARRIGIWDIAGYIHAIRKIPIVSQARLNTIVKFMEVVTKTVSELAWSRYVQSKQSRRYLDRIVNRVSDGIISIDAHGKISMVNEAFCKTIGFRKHEIIGQSFSEYISGDACASTYKKILRTVRKKGHKRVSLQVVDGASRKIPVQVSFDKSREGQGHSSYVAVLRDVSEEVKLAQLKEDLIGMMTHDMGNPIFSIQKAMQLLTTGVLGPLNPDQEELIKLSTNTTQQLSRMVMDYLDIYRHENGKLRLRKEILDLRHIIQESIKQVNLIAEEKKISICYDPPPDALNFMGDHLRLIRICTNLLGNAIKFSPVGGKIDVATRYVTDSGSMLSNGCQSSVRAQRDLPGPKTPYVLTEITDQGPGIKKGLEKTIFNKFSTSRYKDVKNSGGVGLGLAFCKLAVTAHHGFIGVSAPLSHEKTGSGARFYFALPADTKVRFQSLGMEF